MNGDECIIKLHYGNEPSANSENNMLIHRGTRFRVEHFIKLDAFALALKDIFFIEIKSCKS